jgi:branched-chain amino acid aminotransferase
MIYFNYNGKLYPEGTPVIGPDNRGLRFGDGLFETMKFDKDRIILFEEHMDRFWNGLEKLAFEIPVLLTRNSIQKQVTDLLKKNNHVTARVRLTAVRGNGGLYDAADHHPHIIIQSWPMNREPGLNSNGLQLCIYRDALKTCDSLSNLKHNNYLCYLMGALFAKKNKCNDAVILNQHLRVCDSTIANIFIIKDSVLYTPSLAEGCVGGIMRQYLLKQLPSLGFKVQEEALTEERLLNADEIFLSNSIYNIKWVASIDDKTYNSLQTQKIYDVLSKTNDSIIC